MGAKSRLAGFMIRRTLAEHKDEIRAEIERVKSLRSRADISAWAREKGGELKELWRERGPEVKELLKREFIRLREDLAKGSDTDRKDGKGDRGSKGGKDDKGGK